LTVVDTQTKLAAAMPPAERDEVVHNTAILLQAASLLSVPVLLTEQYPKGLGRTEAALIQHLPPATPVIEKTCFSCCGAADFMEAVRHNRRNQIILAGMEAHVCVLQTALGLSAQGLQIFVVEDAVCSRRSENKTNALARLRQAGIVVTNTESVLFEWLRDANHEHFKTISAFIR
jgi:nicotinamidase-related amidase